MNDLFDVSGKTALVTGGSRGIGLMIARGLVQSGARVIISSRKAADVHGAASELAALGDCTAIPGDISTPEGAAELAGAVQETYPSLDILVNNAGACGARRSRSSRRAAGRRSCTRTSRASST
jgi:NAD(P)-dependent dehydrogenase (short-subunit alcohol dehydrogenase family)